MLKDGPGRLETELEGFQDFGSATRIESLNGVPVFVNEFWTARQRAASSLHEVSYRACFKPQLPRFFIERLTWPGDTVYDPFMGRGTTVLEAALLGRAVVGCDVNPLSCRLVRPRLRPPALETVSERLANLDLRWEGELPEDLLVFYHPVTLREICALRRYLQGVNDEIDDWIRMVAINRLTGHSPGFFSVYTLPPNQAVSVQAQRRINAKRQQIPPHRDVRELILKKSRALLTDCDERCRRQLGQQRPRLFVGECFERPEIADNSVDLVVTSPPFLDVVDYQSDNWLRCWFSGIEPGSVKLTQLGRLSEWQEAMTRAFQELYRMVRPGGHVAFEVGEVRHGKIRLEEAALPCGQQAGFEARLLLINQQEFTKTANCWGVDNGSKGTNTNRVLLLRKS